MSPRKGSSQVPKGRTPPASGRSRSSPVVGIRTTRSNTSSQGSRGAAQPANNAPRARPTHCSLPPRSTRRSAKEAPAKGDTVAASQTAKAAQVLADLKTMSAPGSGAEGGTQLGVSSPSRTSARNKKRKDYAKLHKGTPPSATQIDPGQQADAEGSRAQRLQQEKAALGDKGQKSSSADSSEEEGSSEEEEEDSSSSSSEEEDSSSSSCSKIHADVLFVYFGVFTGIVVGLLYT